MRVQRFVSRPFEAIVQRNHDALKILTAQSGLLARRGLQPRYRSLHDAELRVFSQWGEDGILDLLCDALGLAKPRVLEFGAGDFRECNSRFLAENRSAFVVAVDSREDLPKNIDRTPLSWRTHIKALVRWITPSNAVSIFAEAVQFFEGRAPDIFSIDLDGVDYWVTEQLDLTGVRIVVVEYNPLFGPTDAVSVPPSENFDRTTAHASWLYFGASLRAWTHLLGTRGFTFVGSNRQGNNAFFVESGSIGALPVEPVDLRDLARFTDWNVRESRNPQGRLSYLSGRDRIRVMADAPVTDVVTGAVRTVGSLA
jgi:hypothetical protein